MENVKCQYETLLHEIYMDRELYGESSTEGFKFGGK